MSKLSFWGDVKKKYLDEENTQNEANEDAPEDGKTLLCYHWVIDIDNDTNQLNWASYLKIDHNWLSISFRCHPIIKYDTLLQFAVTPELDPAKPLGVFLKES